MTVACPCKIEVRWHLNSILHALILNLAKNLLDSILGHLKSNVEHKEEHQRYIMQTYQEPVESYRLQLIPLALARAVHFIFKH
jgi:hypothetical protein